MIFEKKYWSENEFKNTADLSNYIGYVGISDGKAYNFETEDELIGGDTYLSRVNCSKNNFDRALGVKLKLPNNKQSIQFAANDFLYSTTVKEIVNKLQENNDYIFRNSIISNSVLPAADNCTLLATEDISEYNFYYINGHNTKYIAPPDAYMRGNKIYQAGSLLGNAIMVDNENAKLNATKETYSYSKNDNNCTARYLYSLLAPSNGELRNYKKIPQIKSEIIINKGILRKYNLSSKAYSTITNTDSTFYQQTTERKKIYANDISGSLTENLSNNTKLILNSDEIRRPSDLTFIPTKTTPKEIWEELNGVEDNSLLMEQQKALTDSYYIQKYNFNHIIDNISDKEIELLEFPLWRFTKSRSFNFILSNSKLNNFYLDIYNNPNIVHDNILNVFNFKVNSLSLIIKGSYIPQLTINETTVSAAYTTELDTNLYFVTYVFNGGVPVVPGSIIVQEITTSTAKINVSIQGRFNKEIEFIVISNSNNINNNNPKLNMEVQVGTVSLPPVESGKYKYIPHITRSKSCSFKWRDKNKKVYIAPEWVTYGYLKTTEEWINGEGSLIWVDLNGNEKTGKNSYVPNDEMTANNCHTTMYNMVNSDSEYVQAYYDAWPALNVNSGNKNDNTVYDYSIRRTGGAQSPYVNILNEKYINKQYPMEIPLINEMFISRGFKSANTAFAELTGTGIHKSANYDIIPELIEKEITEEIGDKPLHNFSEIQACDVLIKDVKKDANGHYADLLIFIAFKTKILILKTKHYITPEYKNFTVSESGNENILEDMSLEQKLQDYKDIYLDLRKDGLSFIELDTVNPDEYDSLKFLSIESIKVHKNMLYVVDSRLNMVLRYNINYLVSRDEDIDSTNTFNIKSIALIDTLQGDGDLKDKIYFNKPYCIDVDDDRAYIVDRNNNCVKVYSSSLNFIKILKNGFYASHDIQAVGINPFKCTIKGIDIKEQSVWIVSSLSNRIFVSVLEDDEVKYYGQIEDISLVENKYSWKEEIRSIKFSETNSNYYYLATNKRIYKFHVSNPLYPYASISYFKQRSLISSMMWSSMNYPWNKIPSLYAQVTDDINKNNEITWGYVPPVTSAEILDNKCFALAAYSDNANKFEGDIIFHYGILYDDNKVRDYIKNNENSYDKKQFTFNDIPSSTLATFIKSSLMTLYREPASYVSSVADPYMKIFEDKIVAQLDNDYINALTFNKLLYSVIHNLLKIKNLLVGKFRAATNLDNVLVYDNLLLDDFFNNLQLKNHADYFTHDNEVVSIVINRVFENIYDLQEKILEEMQTTFMSTQSFVNNSSRII